MVCVLDLLGCWFWLFWMSLVIFLVGKPGCSFTVRGSMHGFA